MGVCAVGVLILFACIANLAALEGNGGDTTAASQSTPAVAVAASPSGATSKAPVPKSIAAIARGISRLEVKLEKLTNRIERLSEMERLKKIMRNVDKKKKNKMRRGASVAASANKRGAAVAVAASRRASGGTGASNGKKRKPAQKPKPAKKKPAPRQKPKPVTAKPTKRRPAKKNQPLVGFHKNKRGGTSVAVAAGNAAVGAAAD